MGKFVKLHCTDGGSDKIYEIHLEDRANGQAIVYGMNGRRGSTLTRQDKTDGPVSINEALRIFTNLQNEKIHKKRYRLIDQRDTPAPGGRSIAIVETEVLIESGKVSKKITTIPVLDEPVAKKVILGPQLLNPITEAEAMSLIEDDDYFAMEKKDGHRRLALSDSKVMGLNKKGEEVPLLENVAKSLPKGMVLAIDGELIGEKYHAFDILMRDKRSLREVDAIRRHQILSSIEFGKDITVVYAAHTTEEKRALFERLKKEKKEGIVFKRKTSPYKSGRPNSGGDQLKYKFQNTASFIVDSITKGKRSVGLVLLDGKNRIPVGKCTIPPNKEVPKVGSIVEVQYLYAYEGGAIFQPVYLNERDDVDAKECITRQLVFKSKETDKDEE
jgi:bifunctional non-homologous end joining protein LigD